MKGDTGGALSDYNRALARDPRWVSALVNRAVLRTERQELALALADLKRALELAPRHGDAWYNYGQALTRSGRLAEARSALVTARGLLGGERRRRAEVLLGQVEQRLR